MKKTLLILSIVALSSCSKDWNCEVKTTSILGSSTYETEFTGTVEEKNQFESDGTVSYPDGEGGSIDMETKCYAN